MAPTGDFYEAALRSEHQKNKHRLWLADVVNRLSGRYVSKCAELTYWNHPGLPQHLRAEGYYVCFQTEDRSGHPIYVMISRSHTSEQIDVKQIAKEFDSEEVVFPFEKFGEYYAQRKRRRGPGIYATIKIGPRWYMLSVCGQLKPHYRLVQVERSRNTNKALTFKEYMDLVGHPGAKGGSES